MASANNSGSAGCGQLNEAKACTPDQPLPHPHFQAGENSLVRRQRSPTSAKTKERPRKRLRQPNSGLAKHHPVISFHFLQLKFLALTAMIVGGSET